MRRTKKRFNLSPLCSRRPSCEVDSLRVSVLLFTGGTTLGYLTLNTRWESTINLEDQQTMIAQGTDLLGHRSVHFIIFEVEDILAKKSTGCQESRLILRRSRKQQKVIKTYAGQISDPVPSEWCRLHHCCSDQAPLAMCTCQVAWATFPVVDFVTNWFELTSRYFKMLEPIIQQKLNAPA